MKKVYDAPVLELISLCSLDPISATTGVESEDLSSSAPWNDGELGWT